MDQSKVILQQVTASNCENCKKEIVKDQPYCQSCGFPVNGTGQDKELFYHQLGAMKFQLQNLEKKIYNARVTMWVIAGLTFLVSIITYIFYPETEDALLLLIINGLVSIVFLALANLANQKPFTALSVGLILYILLLLYGLIDGQGNLFGGIFIKILVIVFLIKGVNSAREAEEMKKEISQHEGKRVK